MGFRECRLAKERKEKIMKIIKITAGIPAKIKVLDCSDVINYQVLQELMGSYIEIVRPKGLESPFVMVIDEEERLKKKPINVIGSYFYGFQEHGEPIVGDVLLVKEIDTADGRDICGLSVDETFKLFYIVDNLAE